MSDIRTSTALAAALILLTVGSVLAGRMETQQKRVELTDEKELAVEIDFGVGDLLIGPGESGDLVVATGHIDPRRFDYEFDYKKKTDRGDLYFDVSTVRDSWDDLRNESNEWRFEFTDEIPLDFTIDIGASSCEFRLGGLMITRLDLDIGAADCEISFDEPNKSVLERILIDAGASSVYIDMLGNARFELLEFDGGVGSYDIDFSGDFDFDAEAEISVGLGSVDIVLPEHIGVRLRTSNGLLSNIDFPEHKFRELDDDLFESLNWDDATGHLELELDIGMGSADVMIR